MKKAERINIRCSTFEKAYLQGLTRLLGVDLTTYVMNAVWKQAENDYRLLAEKELAKV